MTGGTRRLPFTIPPLIFSALRVYLLLSLNVLVCVCIKLFICDPYTTNPPNQRILPLRFYPAMLLMLYRILNTLSHRFFLEFFLSLKSNLYVFLLHELQL